MKMLESQGGCSHIKLGTSLIAPRNLAIHVPWRLGVDFEMLSVNFETFLNGSIWIPGYMVMNDVILGALKKIIVHQTKLRPMFVEIGGLVLKQVCLQWVIVGST